MRKKHPVKNFFILLLIASIVAGLAALPMLTAGKGDEENKASILAGTPQRRTLSRKLYSGGALISQEPEVVSVPEGVQITRLLVNTGDMVHAGDPVAEVDDLSVMNAVKSVQETLDTVSKSLQNVRTKITPGIITVNASNELCVNGQKIATDKLTYYTQFADLAEQHREYEKMLLELFELRVGGVVKAPCDGIVGNMDKSVVVKQLSASDTGRLMPLALHTPNGDDSIAYACYAQQIVGFTEDGNWRVRWGTNSTYIQDFTELGELSLTLSKQMEDWEPETVFAYIRTENDADQEDDEAGEEAAEEGAESADADGSGNDGEGGDETEGRWEIYQPVLGDYLMYALDNSGNYWVIFVRHGSVEGGHNGSTGGIDLDGLLSGLGGFSGFGGRSGTAGSQGQSSNLYSTGKTMLCTVTPAQTMQLILPIDEADITALEIGMTAELTLEALPNRKFTGTIKEISQFGLNSGGSSKFDVTLEVPCSEDMLPGMNANVSMELETVENCITVPVAALVDQGSKTVIYTAYDEKNETLMNPVPLTLGLSDGENVQVLSGITENTSFWYSYYDTLEISTAVETRGMFG